MRCQSSSVERAAHVARNHVSWVVTGTTPSFWRVQAEPWRGKGDSLEIINVKPSTIRHHSVSVPTTCRHIVRLAARRIPLQTRPSGTPTPRCVLQPPGASGQRNKHTKQARKDCRNGCPKQHAISVTSIARTKSAQLLRAGCLLEFLFFFCLLPPCCVASAPAAVFKPRQTRSGVRGCGSD